MLPPCQFLTTVLATRTSHRSRNTCSALKTRVRVKRRILRYHHHHTNNILSLCVFSCSCVQLVAEFSSCLYAVPAASVSECNITDESLSTNHSVHFAAAKKGKMEDSQHGIIGNHGHQICEEPQPKKRCIRFASDLSAEDPSDSGFGDLPSISNSSSLGSGGENGDLEVSSFFELASSGESSSLVLSSHWSTATARARSPTRERLRGQLLPQIPHLAAPPRLVLRPPLDNPLAHKFSLFN